MKKIFQVAIDSPAASGAGTQAQLICKYYNFFILIQVNFIEFWGGYI